MKIQVSLDGKVDHLLHPIRLGGFSVDVEFADAAIVAQRIFFLDEIENGRIVEPGLDVVAHAIGPDEWHDLELGPFCVHELMRALVGPAGRNDAGNAVTAKNLAYLVERIKRPGLLVVMQVRVENFHLLLCLRGQRSSRQSGQRRYQLETPFHPKTPAIRSEPGLPDRSNDFNSIITIAARAAHFRAIAGVTGL